MYIYILIYMSGFQAKCLQSISISLRKMHNPYLVLNHMYLKNALLWKTASANGLNGYICTQTLLFKDINVQLQYSKHFDSLSWLGADQYPERPLALEALPEEALHL